MTEIAKIIDEREIQKKQTNKQIKTEKSKGERSYSQKVRAKWFMCAFKISPINV